MTKAEIIQEVAAVTGLTQVETEAVLDEILHQITEALKRGERVDMRGFGSFTVQHRKARSARNTATQDVVQLPERHLPVFKVSKILQEKVNKAILRGFN